MPQQPFTPAEQRYSRVAFCPYCGHRYEKADFHAQDLVFVCARCALHFYQNPAPAAVVAVGDRGAPESLLMLRRNTPPNAGRWCLPGGFIHYGETPVVAAAREFREETGAEAVIGAVLRTGLVDYAYQGLRQCVVEIAFRGELRGRAPLGMTTAEAAEIAFLPARSLLDQPGQLAFPEQLDVMRAFLGEAASRL